MHPRPSHQHPPLSWPARLLIGILVLGILMTIVVTTSFHDVWGASLEVGPPPLTAFLELVLPSLVSALLLGGIVAVLVWDISRHHLTTDE